MVVKLLGVVDLIAAAIIFSTHFGGVFDKLRLILVAILVIKAIPSLMG